MATIDDLNTSILDLSAQQIVDLIREIRTRRRIKGKVKRSKPAKVKRAPKKKNLRQQDIFAYVKGMSEEEKLKLAKKLLGD